MAVIVGNGGGTLTGTDQDDQILATDNQYDKLYTIEGGAGRDVITVAYGEVHAGEGDDIINIVNGVAYGGEGNDILHGGGQLYGEAGNDTLYGGWLDGGTGNDNLYALHGGFLSGGSGNDVYHLKIGSAWMTFNDGWGHDSILGQAYMDYFYFNDVTTSLRGVSNGARGGYITDGTNSLHWDGDQVYELHLGSGNDTFVGGTWIFGGGGNDILKNGSWMRGEAGDDRIYGGQGIQTIEGGEGDDYLNGGQGCDLYRVGEGHDIIDDKYGNNQLGWSSVNGNNTFNFKENIVYDDLGNSVRYSSLYYSQFNADELKACLNAIS